MPAPKYWIEYAKDWRSAPMAYWVHAEQDGKMWRSSESYLPPAPRVVPHKGYRVVCIEVSGVTLRFSSSAQIAEFIRVLSLKPLPTSKRLSALRGTGHGPNTHWLSRLPTALKSTKGRPRVVARVREVLRSVSA